MSWQITEIVKNTDNDIEVSVDFDVAGVKKADALIVLRGDHGKSDEEFFNHVVGECQRADSESIKDQSTKDADKATKEAAKSTSADDTVTESNTGTFKLKNLKDTDV